MAFDWMESPLPADIAERNEQHRTRMAEEDVRIRARLLHRLGHSEADATHRCLGNRTWAHEPHGRPVLSEDDVRRLVKETWKRMGRGA